MYALVRRTVRQVGYLAVIERVDANGFDLWVLLGDRSNSVFGDLVDLEPGSSPQDTAVRRLARAGWWVTGPWRREGDRLVADVDNTRPASSS